MKTHRILGIACLAMAFGGQALRASGIDFKDWTATSIGNVSTFTNASTAGTITGSMTCPGCWGAPTGTFGVPTAITSQQFTTEFSADGQSAGRYMEFIFSSGYGWGSGGQMILGNIHNEFEYTLSAWASGGAAINVNSWTLLGEFPSTAPGTLGYFSTSSTQHTASGDSELFFVNDPLAEANSGQGGVLWIDGLQNVERLRLTLSDSALAPNAQASDFILFNVGTPTAAPEPAAFLVTGLGLTVLSLLRRRKR